MHSALDYVDIRNDLLHSVAMKPDELLKLASAVPGKYGLADYRDTIVLLRNKGHSWRDVADFLKKNGIGTDHTTVYRYMMEENPLFDCQDLALEIGGLWYESQSGRPLRPFNPGLFITIVEKLKSIQLEHPERVRSNWCEYQFRLSGAPNRIWLKQLHEELAANFNNNTPYHLISRMGFELKFDRDVMALDCLSANLNSNYEDVRKAFSRSTDKIGGDKTRWAELSKIAKAKEEKILAQYDAPGYSPGELLDEHAEGYSEHSKVLEEAFQKLPL